MARHSLPSKITILRTRTGAGAVLIDDEPFDFPLEQDGTVSVDYPNVLGGDYTVPVAYLPIVLSPDFEGVVTRYVSREEFDELTGGTDG